MLDAFRRLRVSHKIMVPLVLLALVGAGASGFVGRALLRIDDDYSLLIEREGKAATAAGRLNLLVVDLARGTWRAMALATPEELATSRRDLDSIRRETAALAALVRPVVQDTPLVADLDSVSRDVTALHAVALRGLEMLEAGRTEEARTLTRTEFTQQITALRATSRRLTEGLVAAAGTQSNILRAQNETTVRNVLAVLAIGIVSGLGFGIWMVGATVTRPIRRLDGTMQRLAAGDLAAEVGDAARGDEIGSMARALRGFAAGLREAEAMRGRQETDRIEAERERKAALVAMAGSLEAGVGGVVDGIAAAATELNAAAVSMVSIAEGTTGRAGTVGAATAAASGNVTLVAAATEELAASVAEIGRQVSEGARMAAASVEQAERTNRTVAHLTDAATQIGEVTRLIGDIAGQTNLLALNATIEAARAGEAGRGFAVVASEVKALATQTAQATGSIATQIQAMQAATRDAAAEIGAIRESIGRISEVTGAIAAAVEQQGAATRDIALNVQRAADGTGEIAVAIEGVSAAAGETSGAASQVQSTSADLAEQAETLRRAVGDFLGRVRAA